MPEMKIAILRETKTPPDRRVPFTPNQCRMMLEQYPGLEICIQPDPHRCFSNSEYIACGIKLQEEISNCDLLVGVKEVKTSYLIPGKSYMFFSHTAKKQKHNLDLLRSIITNRIELIDYEYLTDENNTRIVAFGRWAGFVGAYNAMRAYGLRYGLYNLKPAWKCKDSSELLHQLSEVRKAEQKIVLTGGGRVASGAMEILDSIGFIRLKPADFLNSGKGNIYTQLDPENYVKHKEDASFNLNHFFRFPQEYENSFLPYTEVADLFIACHFWDPRSPVLMTQEDMKDPKFRIKLIADIYCDTDGPIPSTLRASTIENPFYGYDVQTGQESDPFELKNITVMSVDNLPGELPRDASNDFGNRLVSEVIPSFLGFKDPSVINRATIAKDGKLTDAFAYLKNFLEGKE